MAPPVIGVTATHSKNEQGYPAVLLLRAYVIAMIEAGGIPVLIPPDLNRSDHMVLASHLDGILFTGGGDLDPEHFHGTPHMKIEGVNLQRDEIELALLTDALKRGLPFLGICRGIQMINVGLGGTLYTHIEDQVPGALKHDFFPDYPRDYLAHTVEIEKGTRLAGILGATTLNVNSFHHQGVDSIAPAAKGVAHAPDGLVEALEVPDHPFGFGVQWHPEWLTDQEPTRRLFRAFVEAASDYPRP